VKIRLSNEFAHAALIGSASVALASAIRRQLGPCLSHSWIEIDRYSAGAPALSDPIELQVAACPTSR